MKVPKNGHVAVGSSVDVWLCDYGYEEVGNSCVLIEKEVEVVKVEKKEVVEDDFVVEAEEMILLKDEERGVKYKTDGGGGGVAVVAVFAGGVGYLFWNKRRRKG